MLPVLVPCSLWLCLFVFFWCFILCRCRYRSLLPGSVWCPDRVGHRGRGVLRGQLRQVQQGRRRGRGAQEGERFVLDLSFHVCQHLLSYLSTPSWFVRFLFSLTAFCSLFAVSTMFPRFPCFAEFLFALCFFCLFCLIFSCCPFFVYNNSVLRFPFYSHLLCLFGGVVRYHTTAARFHLSSSPPSSRTRRPESWRSSTRPAGPTSAWFPPALPVPTP